MVYGLNSVTLYFIQSLVYFITIKATNEYWIDNSAYIKMYKFIVGLWHHNYKSNSFKTKRSYEPITHICYSVGVTGMCN